MLLDKTMFYEHIEAKENHERRQDELMARWNEYICWEGSDEEVADYVKEVREIKEALEVIEADLDETRNNLDPLELQRWRKEWYDINE